MTTTMVVVFQSTKPGNFEAGALGGRVAFKASVTCANDLLHKCLITRSILLSFHWLGFYSQRYDYRRYFKHHETL